MEIVIILLVVALIIACVSIGWLLNSLKGLKLNDETYMYEKQDHLPTSTRPRKKSTKNNQGK